MEGWGGDFGVWSFVPLDATGWSAGNASMNGKRNRQQQGIDECTALETSLVVFSMALWAGEIEAIPELTVIGGRSEFMSATPTTFPLPSSQTVPDASASPFQPRIVTARQGSVRTPDFKISTPRADQNHVARLLPVNPR